jgi:dipeptidyl aminopeptidase/acylaminoacyl peptidase
MNSCLRRPTSVLVLTAALCLGLVPRVLPAQPVTIESVLGAPFPTELVASPRGETVAWAFDDQGKKNVWAAQAPDFKARLLTHFDLDDGQEISGLVFSFDGSTVVFVRGQGPNRAGESPNPTSNPAGAEQAVWAVKVADAKPWRIGAGDGPVASPAENRVVYSLRGRLFTASLDGPAAAKPLFQVRGSSEMYSFSRNGQRLAFSSERGDHALIGIYDLKAGTVVWVSPSVDRDIWPAFSPDLKHLAFIRFPGGRAEEMELEGGLPFSVMVADAATGQARTLWTSPNPSGGFAQTYFAPPWAWAADSRIVFYSEHEGWMHLYALDTTSGKVESLTPGEFEVEDSCLSPDLKTLIYNSNQGDVDRRHLWAVPVSGGTPRALTQGPSLEWRPKALAGGRLLAFLCSTALRPAAPAVMGLDGRDRRLIAPELIPASFPSAELVEPQAVVFKSPDGLAIHGQLFLPKGAQPGDRRPAAIFMHGGPIRQMLLGFHYMFYYHNTYAFNEFLASKGYVVLSVNYRLGIGYGRAFREAARGGYRGASEYQDIVAAGSYLRNRPDVDPNRIGLWGGSYGGYLTALGLARNSDLFAAGVDLHGVHDWSAYFRAYGDLLGGDRAEEARRLALDSSPVAAVDFWSSPVLFIHGDDDRNVEFSQTVDLVRRLRAIGRVHLELLVFPDEIHDFLRHADWLTAYRAAYDFFERMMK